MRDYKYLLTKLVDKMAEYEERAIIFKRNDIPRAHFYNVTNDDRLSSSGKPYHTPVDWVIKLTNDSKEYCIMRMMAKDTGGVYLSPDEVAEFKEVLAQSAPDPLKVLGILQKLTAESK